MSLSQHLAGELKLADFLVESYLTDLSDEDLLIRPVPGANHLAWQLGHLISSEHAHLNALSPDCMPRLPNGFRERHVRETAGVDDPAAFLTKAEYITERIRQREGTLLLLRRLGDDELQRPVPEELGYFGPTVAHVFSGEALHWAMHAGQWTIIRRKLGKPPLF
ncbi:MAG: DinB family protein [Planctomycetaceae bacterium]|nr:DinB family protein [Planctomycetaceae bacterium]